MAYPDIFAGVIIGSGATYATASQLSSLLGIPIRNFVGSNDEAGLAQATNQTASSYVRLRCAVHLFLAQAKRTIRRPWLYRKHKMMVRSPKIRPLFWKPSTLKELITLP